MKNIIFPIFIAFLLSACEQPLTQRSYTEIVVDSPLRAQGQMAKSPHPPMGTDMRNITDPRMQDALMDSKADIDFQWSVPEGWREESGGSLALVKLYAQDSPGMVCSVTSLKGMAGGLKANVQRWLRQVNLNSITPQELDAFLKGQNTIQTLAGKEAQLIDFTELQNDQADNVPSMLAAVMDFSDKTIFIKMSASKGEILKNREKFISFSKSIHESNSQKN